MAAVIGVGVFVALGRVLMLLLDRCSAHVLVVLCKPLVVAGFVMDAARPAAEAYVAVAGDKASFHALMVFKGVVEAMAVNI